MAGAKVTMVTLSCSALNVTRPFEIEHAERLLARKPNGGWMLADANFTYSDEDGLQRTKAKIGDKAETGDTAKGTTP